MKIIKSMRKVKEIVSRWDIIKYWLPYGSMRIIAARTGYSEKTVRDVLRGYRRNEKIVRAALELARENKKQGLSNRSYEIQNTNEHDTKN